MATITGVTDRYWITAKEGFTTTTSGSVSSGATTVGLNSVSGYTNGQEVVLVIDPTDITKKQVFKGTVDTTGVQITNVVWTEGTNQTHTAGSTVVDYTTATHQAVLAKGLAVAHDTDGTLKAGAVDNTTVLADNIITTAKLQDGIVTGSKIVNNTITSSDIDWTSSTGKIWWEELGRTTLGANADTISVSSFTAKKYLMIIHRLNHTGGGINSQMTFNGDSGASYAYRVSSNGAADATQASGTFLGLLTAAESSNLKADIFVDNFQTLEKEVHATLVTTAGSGATQVPSRRVFAGKWANTSAQITTVTITNTGAGDFATGSELIVLGHD